MAGRRRAEHDQSSREQRVVRLVSTNNSLISLLSQTALFGSLETEDLAQCASFFREMHFAKGAMLFARGEPGTHLYLVREGRVRLAITSEDGRELSFRHAAPGDLFGEIAALDGSLRTADATALTAATVYSLERSALRELLSTRPGISAGIIAFLCRRLRETSDQLGAIALYPLDVRLARFLLMVIGDQKAAPGKRLPLELGFSQGELAQLLGASRPKVNIALGTLESAGAIKRTQDRLFCDPSRLAEIAGRDDDYAG